MPSIHRKLASTAAIPARKQHKRSAPPVAKPKRAGKVVGIAPNGEAALPAGPAGEFESGDFVWGSIAIAKYLRISRASFFYLWGSGKLDAAVKKIGHKTLAARKSRLDALLAGELGA
jgi:hypothetical protein